MSAASEKSIFLDAMEIGSLPAREQFLRDACGNDAALRSAVDDLLLAHGRTDNPLDVPLISGGALIDPSGALRASPDQTVDYQPLIAEIGSAIGPYTLRELIGEGGFGLVYVAEQQTPVKRMVALKIIKPGMDTREVIARFEAERQALAMMDHPNIARVFDAGETDAGRPYFAMELVRGVPITQFCDDHKVAAVERLELFVTVCWAVQHAHQKGVIHRDIKPSNVLVTMHDGLPLVKVIDFGVAKAIGPALSDKTVYTRFAAMIGTPLYMSPEQAEMTSQDVDTRSDIYSLGVVLYELLTGATPFDSDRLQRAGLDEMRRIIREEEPPRPSTRLSTLGEAISTVSLRRNMDATRLPEFMRGDLDWIVMKALEKDRNRRYESASALASDVQRFLRQEPVVARPPSPGYRFSRFARRNKGLLTTAALVLTTLVLGTTTSVWQAVRATRESVEKDRALRTAEAARQEAVEAREQVEQFNERITEVNLLAASGRAHANAGRWADAHDDFTIATELLPSYYLAWTERGSAFARLGLWSDAARDFRQALDLGAVASGSSWWGVPQIFAYLGDIENYQRVCRQGIELVDGPSDLNPGALRACVLLANSLLDHETLVASADSLVDSAEQLQRRRLSREERRPPRRDPPRLYRRPGPGRSDEFEPPGRRGRDLQGRAPERRGPQSRRRPAEGPPLIGEARNRISAQPRGALFYIAGMAYYRAGEFTAAKDALHRATQEDPSWLGRILARPALAMAHYQLGEDQRAEDLLADDVEQFSQLLAQLIRSPIGAAPIPWFDWIEYQLLHRQAVELITGKPPAEDPRQLELQQRAQAAVAGEETVDGAQDGV